MRLHGDLEPATIHDRENAVESDWQVPRFVEAMLQNVHLYREKTTPPLEHRGDFWYWKLTAYGLALMRVLVRASENGFSYSVVFWEDEPDVVPQLAFLGQLNAAIHAQLTDERVRPDWAAVLAGSPYLRDVAAIIDTALFRRRIDHMTTQIRLGRYDPSGSRVYVPRQR